MKKLNAKQIRDTFLGFFKEKDHLIIPGAKLVPENDPTLLFINSGMAPLKKYFLGIEVPPKRRLANYQICIRTRDIDDVGDRHHMTLFEMLGSWSIGDYYKQLAVELAWELLVDRFQFPKEKLYVSVYGGNPAIKLSPDEESAQAWESVGVSKDHIVVLGDDNFWGPAGETGPCGPCTEVFFDTGEAFGPAYKPGSRFDTSNRYIEIWNAGVFMEFNKGADGRYTPLPLKSVDTGSGLERMELVMNGFHSAYETSGLRPILDLVRNEFHGTDFSEREYRILVDHLRASTFILAEGVQPSNEGQGYIPRRLIRKCVSIGIRADKPRTDFAEAVDMVLKLNEEAYPHLRGTSDKVIKALRSEVKDFEPVIQRGLGLIETELEKSGEIVPSRFVFDMVSTHGVPLDLIRDLAKTKGKTVDEAGYEGLFEEHRAVSRAEGRANTRSVAERIDPEELMGILENPLPTRFVGYSKTESAGIILSLIAHKKSVQAVNQGDVVFIIADETPFYAEAGGQTADRGKIESARGSGVVVDVIKASGVWFHQVQVTSGAFGVGESIGLNVDRERRARIRSNHSATHLLHAALRQTLGSHASQKGSRVDENRLRFDFQNSSPVSPEQIRTIEILVNRWIRENAPVTTDVMPLDKAIQTGAIAMFGEKYEQSVRVVRMTDNSRELCGGTHVETTGQIGTFLITSESSIAKGIRRIEAVTGEAAIQFVQERLGVLQQVAALLNTHASNIIAEVEKLKSKPAEKREPVSTAIRGEKTATAGGLKLVILNMDGSTDSLRMEAEARLNKKLADVVVAAGIFEDQAKIVVMSTKASAEKVRSGDYVKQLLEYVEGRGGGKPTLAEGAGRKISGIQPLLENAPRILESLAGK